MTRVYGVGATVLEAQPEAAEADRTMIPRPHGSGHLDRVRYRSVRFYGAKLSSPLAEAVQYLQQLELLTGRPPHVLCVNDAFSPEDEGTDLAWQVTLVFSEPPTDL